MKFGDVDDSRPNFLLITTDHQRLDLDLALIADYYREMQRAGGPQPKEHGVGENEMTPVMTITDETRTLTHWTAQTSIDFLETRDETRPFFLWTSFTKPHPPFDGPAELLGNL